MMGELALLVAGFFAMGSIMCLIGFIDQGFGD
jgi:hypothetical protein